MDLLEEFILYELIEEEKKKEKGEEDDKWRILSFHNLYW